jgi:putative metallopeptidase DUF4344
LASFYHETGHMVIDLYELPATGREEDAADQASAYLLLQRDEDGRFAPESVQAIMDSGRWFGAMSSGAGGEVDDEELADVHSPDRARMFNMVCWAYGADPATSSRRACYPRLGPTGARTNTTNSTGRGAPC